jgi:hypothetical protein
MGQAAREAADALSWLAALGGAAAFAFAAVFAIPVRTSRTPPRAFRRKVAEESQKDAAHRLFMPAMHDCEAKNKRTAL